MLNSFRVLWVSACVRSLGHRRHQKDPDPSGMKSELFSSVISSLSSNREKYTQDFQCHFSFKSVDKVLKGGPRMEKKPWTTSRWDWSWGRGSSSDLQAQGAGTRCDHGRHPSNERGPDPCALQGQSQSVATVCPPNHSSPHGLCFSSPEGLRQEPSLEAPVGIFKTK